MDTTTWQPTATLSVLKKRQTIIDKIRIFLKNKGYLEVETPLLSHRTVTDPYIASITTKQDYYLQTSPEFAMKRLLVAFNQPIFQISKAFRQEEMGHQHNPEFTMLEWYRPGFDHHDLMTEVDAFMAYVIDSQPAKRLSYQEIFEKILMINPHDVKIKQLKQLIIKHEINVENLSFKDDYLNLLFSHIIEPQLYDPTFIYDYPASQASLAKIKGNVGQRFEFYIRGVELANGFNELCDADEQQHRFNNDLKQRQMRGLPLVKIDENFMNALKNGMNDCAGVALGVDRLVMIATNCQHIHEVIGFPFDRC